MPKARDPNRDKAFELWRDSGGKVDLVEIAERLGVSSGTIRGWKSKDKWDDQLNGTFQSKKRNAPKKGTERSNRKERSIRPEEQSKPQSDIVADGCELPPMQRLFVVEFLVDLNATQAAIRAGYSAKTAEQIGYQLLQKTSVQSAIQEAMRAREKRIELSQDLVVQQLAKIAFADIKDVVTWERGLIQVRPSDEVDGTILAEISETVNDSGFTKKIKLNDRMRALMKLYDHLSDKHSLELEKLRAEIAKSRGDGGGDIEDDGFLDALKGKVAEVWDDEGAT
jgi:phage terminase small subunit